MSSISARVSINETNSSILGTQTSRSAAVVAGASQAAIAHLADVADLGDRHGEVAAPRHAAGTARLDVAAVERARARRIIRAELEQHHCELLAPIGQAAVVPVDHAHSAARRRQDVVGPQVAMTRREVPGRLEQALQRDQLLAAGVQLLRARPARGAHRSGELAPARRADRIGVPGIERHRPLEAEQVDRGEQTTDRRRIDEAIRLPELDPFVDAHMRRRRRRARMSPSMRPYDARRRDAGERRGLLDRGGLDGLAIVERIERLLDGPRRPARSPAATPDRRRRAPPDQSASGPRPGRKPRRSRPARRPAASTRAR